MMSEEFIVAAVQALEDRDGDQHHPPRGNLPGDKTGEKAPVVLHMFQYVEQQNEVMCFPVREFPPIGHPARKVRKLPDQLVAQVYVDSRHLLCFKTTEEIPGDKAVSAADIEDPDPCGCIGCKNPLDGFETARLPRVSPGAVVGQLF